MYAVIDEQTKRPYFHNFFTNYQHLEQWVKDQETMYGKKYKIFKLTKLKPGEK